MLQRGHVAAAAPLGLLILVGMLVGISRQARGTPVVIATVNGNSISRTDEQLYFTAAYTLANHQQTTLNWSDGWSIIVNDTPVPMVVETVRYQMGPGGSSSEDPLPPFAHKGIGSRIDYFGRDDRPPDAVKATGGYDEKIWLRW